jgi:DNA-binding NarL/FixJ family response regulator
VSDQILRILYVEDDERLHSLVPDLVNDSGFEWDCASTAEDALARFETEDHDLVLVDLGLPDLDGVELIERMVTRRPGLPVVVLTVASTEATIVEAMAAGACGYVLKEDMGKRLPAALVDVMQGGVPMSPVAARAILAALKNTVRAPKAASPRTADVPEARELSRREREVVEQLSRGLSYEQVGLVLDVSINTVRVHVRSAYEKLGAASKTEAVMLALARGLVRKT